MVYFMILRIDMGKKWQILADFVKNNAKKCQFDL